MTIFCKAEDVIITKDAQQLKVTIVEVSKDVIKYKEIENPDGPLFIISTDEINSIIFSNGQVKTYTHTVEAIKDNKTIDNNTANNSVKYISRSGNTYSYNGRTLSTDNLAPNSEYSNFLKKNCSAAYAQYERGRQTSNAGWILLGVGAGLDLGTLICAIAGLNSRANVAFSWIGGALELACIPTLIVGYHKMHDSANIFNQQCVSQKQPTAYWSINADANGIGIALNF